MVFLVILVLMFRVLKEAWDGGDTDWNIILITVALMSLDAAS